VPPSSEDREFVVSSIEDLTDAASSIARKIKLAERWYRFGGGDDILLDALRNAEHMVRAKSEELEEILRDRCSACVEVLADTRRAQDISDHGVLYR
jgi:hypothetical protein